MNEFGEVAVNEAEAVDVAVEDNADLELELKQGEAKSFKRLLYLLALTVIAVVGGQRLLIFLIDKGFEAYIASLPAVPIEEGAAAVSEAEPISEAAQNLFYFMLWFLSHLIVFLPPLLIFVPAFKKKLAFEKQGEPYEFSAGWIFPVFIASYALSIVASYVSHILAWILEPVFGGGGLRDVFGDVMPQTAGQYIIMLIMVGFIGPILEELIYRHLLLRPLRRYGDFQAVMITALLFAFFHGNLTQFLYTFTGGLIYGVVAVKMNSVKPVIVLHILNNVFSIFLSWIEEHPDTNEALFNTAFLGFVVVGLTILIIFLVKKLFKTENYNPHLLPLERVRIIAENPLILIMIAVLVAETIAGS